MIAFQGTPVPTSSPRLIYSFYARWCGTCRGVRRALERYETTSPMPIIEVDVERFKPFATLYGIQGVPVILLMENGREIARRGGSTTYEELLEWLANAT